MEVMHSTSTKFSGLSGCALSKLATDLGLPTLKELGYGTKTAFQEQKLEVLRTHP